MKELIAVLCLSVCCMFSFTGCEESHPTAPEASAPDAELPDFALVRNNQNCDWQNWKFNACTGELMHATGCIHELETLEEDATGEMHANFHFQLNHATAVGEESGMVCRATGGHQWTDNSGPPPPDGDPPFEVTGMDRTLWVCPGADNNLTMFMTWHVTFLPGGEVKAEVGDVRTECVPPQAPPS